MTTTKEGYEIGPLALKETITKCVEVALIQVCGGGVDVIDVHDKNIKWNGDDGQQHNMDKNVTRVGNDMDKKSFFRDMAASSISFPNESKNRQRNHTKKKQKQKQNENTAKMKNNKNNNNNNKKHDKHSITKRDDIGGGKPHDVEVRVALTLYHRWKRKNGKSVDKKRENDGSSSNTILVRSDLGLQREISSPKELGQLLVNPLEEALRLCKINPIGGEGNRNIQRNKYSSSDESDSFQCENKDHHPGVVAVAVASDVRCLPSGVICIVTHQRSRQLRQVGKLPCPLCAQWCKGEKGLWWHQQQHHNVEHSEASARASSTCNDDTAIILYNPANNNNIGRQQQQQQQEEDQQQNPQQEQQKERKIPSFQNADDPFDCIKHGDLDGLKYLILNGLFEPIDKNNAYNDDDDDGTGSSCNRRDTVDARGASALMWAAGGGYLRIVQYLIESCNCNPNQCQKGKRSFCGRTSLHWAARNGHLNVVTYLVEHCNVNVDAATIDGTTAFCWACWQGRLDVMKYLWERGRCDIHCVNSFGCNAALWSAQGSKGNDVSILSWLAERDVDLRLVNHNGHGVAHKAAQRGHDALCRWFFENYIPLHRTSNHDERTCPTSHLSSSSYSGPKQVAKTRTASSSSTTTATSSVSSPLFLRLEKTLQLIGPDTEGYCPSDLAGAEGHVELAKTLAVFEMNVIRNGGIAIASSSSSSSSSSRTTTKTTMTKPSHASSEKPSSVESVLNTTGAVAASSSFQLQSIESLPGWLLFGNDGADDIDDKSKADDVVQQQQQQQQPPSQKQQKQQRQHYLKHVHTTDAERFVFEPWAGVNRMRATLLQSLSSSFSSLPAVTTPCTK